MKRKRLLPPYVKIINNRKKAVRKKRLYTENWDEVRRRVYKRDNYKCVLCDKKGKIDAHHIIPVAVSRDNSMSNLISLCKKCHKKMEAIGYKILTAGGHRSDVRRVELKMIMEAKMKRRKHIGGDARNEKNDSTIDKVECPDIETDNIPGGENRSCESDNRRISENRIEEIGG